MKKYTKKEFIEKAIQIHKNKYDYSLVNYAGIRFKIKIICSEHGIFEQISGNHLIGQGCPKCAGFNKTTEEFINEAKLVHENKYDYSLVEYEKSNKKIIIICNEHGKFYQTSNNHLRGAGYPICKESKGERNIRNYLEKNKVDFIQQKMFDDCKNKESLYFDFYLPNHNLLIEYDGELHYKSVEFFGGDNGLLYRI